MKPRSALFAAIGCGAAAVLLVGVDLALNIEGKLEVQDAHGAWTVVSRTPDASGYERTPYSITPICGTHFRLTLHNGFLWGTTIHVAITASGQSTRTLLDEEWSLAAGAERSFEFNAPNGTSPSTPDTGAPAKWGSSIQVLLDHDYTMQLYAQACTEGSA